MSTAPTVQELLKARFAMVRQDLRAAMDRLGDEDLGWAPRPGMRTIRGQLLEIADKEAETLVWIQTGTWPDDRAPSFGEDASLETIRSRLDALRAETHAFIDSRNEGELGEPVRCPDLWWEALRLPECPLSEVLRNVAAHEWYHTGQLVAYLGARGDDLGAW